MINLSLQKLSYFVEGFRGKKVLLIGDLMLDKYIWGEVSRISPEAPVPVVEVKKETFCLGGVGNVCMNVERLGASPLVVGVVGNDTEGMWIKENTSNSTGIFIDNRRPTTVKTRVIAHQQQIVRVDREKNSVLSSRMEDEILRFMIENEYQGIIISDYNKGVITRTLIKRILTHAARSKIPVFVDPKVDNFTLFSPVLLITPNHYEAERIVHHPCKTDEQIEKAGQEMMKKIETRYIILKRGELGMSVFERDKKAVHIPTQAKEVFDVTGAGDTVIATASLALLSGASIREAALLANIAAGIVVAKIGTATIGYSELLSALEKED
ncbi:MAG: D-glycero-beta-D-manno-heptose-7-phosphate kinase [Candidatus Aminicenantales bacterium]